MAYSAHPVCRVCVLGDDLWCVQGICREHKRVPEVGEACSCEVAECVSYVEEAVCLFDEEEVSFLSEAFEAEAALGYGCIYEVIGC